MTLATAGQEVDTTSLIILLTNKKEYSNQQDAISFNIRVVDLVF